MTNIVLGNIASFVNDSTAATQYNANNALITTAFSDALSKSGEQPNTMSAVLDMNNYNIINLPSPATINSPARLVDVVSNPTISVPTVGTSGSTVPLLNGINTWSGTQTFSTGTVFTSTITSSGTNSWNGNNCFGNTTSTWPVTYNIASPQGNYPLAVIDPKGITSLYIAARSSDWVSNIYNGNSFAMSLLSVHDRTVTSPQPSGVWGAYWQINKTGTASNTIGQFGMEFSFQNLGSSFTIDPYTYNTPGQTHHLRMDSGIGTAVGNPVTSAIEFIYNGNTYNAGIMFGNGSMTTGTLAIQMPTGYGITWYTAASTPGVSLAGGTTVAVTGGAITNQLSGSSYGTNFEFINGSGSVQGFLGTAAGFVQLGSLTNQPVQIMVNNSTSFSVGSNYIEVPTTTYGSLPGSPVAGMITYISNGNSNTWGGAITGTGSDPVLIWYNGSAWTVIGK